MDPELIITDKVKNLQLLHGEASSLAMEPQQYSHTDDLAVFLVIECTSVEKILIACNHKNTRAEKATFGL